ncbi:hypothetical protein POPTR_005G184001v4 [Populus trichocarpa]|uniref:Uncharacterized protein n=1 Tax=Populus trichocarpa TaxID=3694 RepID=A0ACC0T0N4_POPTR|nr:hypothetical protein POPTR_005G184001v4 [Populus trichocarpa]
MALKGQLSWNLHGLRYDDAILLWCFCQAWVTLDRAQLNFGEPDRATENFLRAIAIKFAWVENNLNVKCWSLSESLFFLSSPLLSSTILLNCMANSSSQSSKKEKHNVAPTSKVSVAIFYFLHLGCRESDSF